MNLGLDGTKALVTASSRGIGLACASALAAEGAAVVVSSRDGEHLRGVQRGIGAVGHVVADLRDSAQRTSAVEEAVDILNGLDVLVVNFPPPPKGAFADLSTVDWSEGYDGMLMCAIDLARSAMPHLMQSGRGRIVTITGIAAKQPMRGFIISSAYRSAVTAMAKNLSNEVAEQGVTVNNIAPGTILTEQLRKRLELVSEDDARRAEKDIPVGHRGRPEDVGSACAFLCSAQASFITGQTLGVDGGQLRAIS